MDVGIKGGRIVLSAPLRPGLEALKRFIPGSYDDLAIDAAEGKLEGQDIPLVENGHLTPVAERFLHPKGG